MKVQKCHAPPPQGTRMKLIDDASWMQAERQKKWSGGVISLFWHSRDVPFVVKEVGHLRGGHSGISTPRAEGQMGTSRMKWSEGEIRNRRNRESHPSKAVVLGGSDGSALHTQHMRPRYRALSKAPSSSSYSVFGTQPIYAAMQWNSFNGKLRRLAVVPEYSVRNG
ncbi:hypothetical protein BDD12DRAFT_808579 [Trichophaea hybrida]|nr:hypothetical protein BDD12DRAFT_808579 [Trichophaea hybrida]